jgi:antitoxin (DNA-binding transcriptional repressor) of toxin-antitoxin stability system
MWTVEQAKSEFVDLLRRVDAGEPQVIGAEQSYVVITMADYERLARARNTPHLGRWLVENAPRIGDLELPPRSKDRPVPFDDWTDEELEA